MSGMSKENSAEVILYQLEGISPHGFATPDPSTGMGGDTSGCDSDLVAQKFAVADGYSIVPLTLANALKASGYAYASGFSTSAVTAHNKAVRIESGIDLNALSPYGVSGMFLVRVKGIDNEFKFNQCLSPDGYAIYSVPYHRYAGGYVTPHVTATNIGGPFDGVVGAITSAVYPIGRAGQVTRNFYDPTVPTLINSTGYVVAPPWALHDLAKAWLYEYPLVPASVDNARILGVAGMFLPDLTQGKQEEPRLLGSPFGNFTFDEVDHSTLEFKEDDSLFLVTANGGGDFVFRNNTGVCAPEFPLANAITVESKYLDCTLPVYNYIDNTTEIYFVYRDLAIPDGCDAPDTDKDAQLSADWRNGFLTVCWIDHPNDAAHSNGNLYVRCHPAIKEHIADSANGWIDRQTLETATSSTKCSKVGLVKLPNARTMLSYTRVSTNCYRYSDTMGQGNWTARTTGGSLPVGQFQGGRGGSMAFACQATGQASMRFNRDNKGDKWANGGNFYPPDMPELPVGEDYVSGQRIGAAWTGQEWGMLVSDAKCRVFYMATADGLHPLTFGDLHLTAVYVGEFIGVACSLTCLNSGTLIGLIWDQTAHTTINIVSFDKGKTWIQGGALGIPASKCMPVLVNDGDYVYAVYDSANVPKFKTSRNAGKDWE